MKTIKPYLVILFALMAIGVQAQHFVTGSLQGGYSSTFDNMNQTQMKGLFGAQIGVGYEWQYERLLLDLGVEFSYYKHRWGVTDQTITQRMLDTDNMEFDYIGNISRRSDDFTSTSLRIPMLAGAQFGYFYFLAGLIPDIHFKGTAASTADLVTSGDYSEFYIPLVDMENHGFYTRGISNEQDMRYKFDLLGHIELGASFGDKHKYKLAAFAEVGILDIAPRTDVGKMADPNFDKFMTVTLNNPYLSNEGMFANAHNFEVGLKFTVAIHVADNKDKDKDKDKDDAVQDSINKAIQDSIEAERLAEEAAQASARAAAERISAEEREAELARQRAIQDSIDRAQAYYNSGDTRRPYKPFGPDTELKERDLGRGEQYTLQDIYFDTDRTIVMVPSLPTLKQLYKLLITYPDLRIKIIGHTDAQGNDWYNMSLSRRRAKSVKETLMRWGIDPSRLETDGRGEREPIAPNTTSEGRQLNRRVVFEVL